MSNSLTSTREDDRPTSTGMEHSDLTALVQQAIPMLADPDRYPGHERRQLAQTLTSALEIGADDSNPDTPSRTDTDGPKETEEYEPGCLLETSYV